MSNFDGSAKAGAAEPPSKSSGRGVLIECFAKKGEKNILKSMFASPSESEEEDSDEDAEEKEEKPEEEKSASGASSNGVDTDRSVGTYVSPIHGIRVNVIGMFLRSRVHNSTKAFQNLVVLKSKVLHCAVICFALTCCAML